MNEYREAREALARLVDEFVTSDDTDTRIRVSSDIVAMMDSEGAWDVVHDLLWGIRGAKDRIAHLRGRK